MLGAKLEAYVENIIEEYSESLAQRSPKAKHISEEVKKNSTIFLLSKLSSNFSPTPVALESLNAAANMWNAESTIEKLVVNNKFNYGKHGSKELQSLFSRIGFGDIYARCLITVDTSESLTSSSANKGSVSADIDSLTNIRNNIIHTDANPAALTRRDVLKYRNSIWEFCFQVDLMLQRALEALDVVLAGER